MRNIFFNGVRLKEFCLKEGLVYQNVRQTIWNYKKKKQNLTAEKIVEKVIAKYLDKRCLKRVKDTFQEIEENESFNVTKITRILNIEYSCVYRLLKMGYSKKEAIYIIWYFHDKEKNQMISISKRKAEELLRTIRKKDFKKIDDFMLLLTLYKLGYEDVKELIYRNRTKCLEYITNKSIYCNKIDISYSEDIMIELFLYETTLYPKLVANNIQQNTKYLNLCSKGRILNLIRKYKTNDFHLDGNINDSQTLYDVVGY